MNDRLSTYDVAYVDETTVQVVKEQTKDIKSKKYMWLYSGGPAQEFVYYYQYHPSRSHEVADAFLLIFLIICIAMALRVMTRCRTK